LVYPTLCPHCGAKVENAPATPPLRGWFGLLRAAVSQWLKHKDARLGAGLAYYSVFSLVPLIVIVVAVAGLVFGQDAVRGEVAASLRGLIGDSGADAINGMLAHAGEAKEGVLATIIGVGALVFAAIGVVTQLKDALNTVWEVEAPPAKGIWGFVRTSVVSLAGVVALGFLLLISMVLTAALAAIGKYVVPGLPEFVLQAGGLVVSFVVIALMFAMMFKLLPDAQIEWRDVALGGAITAALFELGKLLIALYHRKTGSRIHLWRSCLCRGDTYLGLLHRTDRAAWCRIHQRLR
jgi:membrane protein